jgi:adenylate kinase family enzyme
MRIDVIGLPASGKSTFAASISKKLSIPHIHLDRFWFEAGGHQGRHDIPNLEEVRSKVREKAIEAVKGESWVSDGIYLHVQDVIAERSEVIIFLDIPLLTRIYGHAQRAFFEPKRHDELGLWDEITFFREIVKRNFSSKPKLLKFVDAHKDKVIRLRSRKEMDEYLKKL